MKQIFTLGRKGDQPFEISLACSYVHGEHARLTVDTDGNDWYLEDLKEGRGNGVFVRDDEGCFRRIIACRIRPTDIVRLGPEDAGSFTFMAHHVLAPEDYKFEFTYLRSLEQRLAEREARQATTIKNHNRNTILAPVGLAAVTMLVRLFVPIDPGVLIAITAGVTAIPTGILRYMYRNDADKLRNIKALRSRLIVCPKCGRPLSEYDLRLARCSACKAM